ncbi:MAG: fluoride efflux transporter CrcB [Clostridiales bacterium]|nr:fluoride efflux transporter CrcB [Candidatus Crickella caballi]
MLNCLAVGIGGFVGSIARYLVSRIEFLKSGSYPLNTLIVNVIGAVLIGLVIVYAEKNGMSEEKLLFLKMGLCGGLTTFSTFSAETLGYIESGNILMGISYVLVSVVLCVLGVYLGMKLGTLC